MSDMHAMRIFGRRRTGFAGLALAAALLLPAHGSVAEDGPPVTYFRIGTGSLAGTYFPVGETIANLISKPPGSAPCEPGGRCGVPGLVATAQASAGSIANVRAVAAGEIDSGLAQADIVDWAWRGANMFAKDGARPNIRVIANLYRESVHIVARRGAGIGGVRDLKGKRVSLDLPESGTAVDARLILAAYGLKDRDMTVAALDTGRAADAILAGDLDAFFFVGGWPAPVIADLARQEAIDLVPIDGPEAAALMARQPFLATDAIPARSYGDLPRTPTLSVGAQWIVSSSADEALVFQLVRALFDPANRPMLERGHPKAAEIRLGTALDGVSVPVHPAAMRFYRLAGVERP
jgi:TRAP transporter TAXI family solute receptor